MEFVEELKAELFKQFPSLEQEYNTNKDVQRNFIKLCYALMHLELKSTSPFLERDFVFLRKRFGILPSGAKLYAVVGRELGYNEAQSYMEKKIIFEKIQHVILYGIYVPDEYLCFKRSKEYQEYANLDMQLRKVFYKQFFDYTNGLATEEAVEESKRSR